jgi:hypothetical protein
MQQSKGVPGLSGAAWISGGAGFKALSRLLKNSILNIMLINNSILSTRIIKQDFLTAVLRTINFFVTAFFVSAFFQSCFLKNTISRIIECQMAT